MPLRGGLCRKVVFASLRGAKVKRFLRWTGLKAGGFLSLTAAYGHACGVRVQRVPKVHRVQRVAVSPSAMRFVASVTGFTLCHQCCTTKRKSPPSPARDAEGDGG